MRQTRREVRLFWWFSMQHENLRLLSGVPKKKRFAEVGGSRSVPELRMNDSHQPGFSNQSSKFNHESKRTMSKMDFATRCRKKNSSHLGIVRRQIAHVGNFPMGRWWRNLGPALPWLCMSLVHFQPVQASCGLVPRNADYWLPWPAILERERPFVRLNTLLSSTWPSAHGDC